MRQYEMRQNISRAAKGEWNVSRYLTRNEWDKWLSIAMQGRYGNNYREIWGLSHSSSRRKMY